MLYVLAGVLCLRNPLQTIAALSLITGVVWLVSGILTLYTAIAVEDLPHRGVLTVAAVLGIVAGIVVLALPAESARATPRSERWPRSGGGTVDRFDLVEKARAAGCRVVLLDADRHQDVTELARQAVAEGADLLAVARAATAPRRWWPEVAARHDLPFVVVPAGTRNHFALDLGLDRDDPAAALEALTHGVELRVDLGYAADRVFVNNASFGTYASIVTDPAYRDATARTTLRTLPGLLTGEDAPRLQAQADGTCIDGLQALLVSNNPYGRAVDAAHPGRRERLDSGLLAWCACGSATPLKRREE